MNSFAAQSVWMYQLRLTAVTNLSVCLTSLPGWVRVAVTLFSLLINWLNVLQRKSHIIHLR